MSYEFPKHHKAEDNIMMDINEMIYDHVLQFYEVDDVEELTEQQIDELEDFRTNTLSEYSVLQCGYSNIINMWESQEGAPLS